MPGFRRSHQLLIGNKGEAREAVMTECPTRCGKPSSSGEMCPACWGRLSAALRSAADLAADLDIALARQGRFGDSGIGIVVRTVEQPLPVNLHVSATATELRGLLGSWVRDLHETHAVRWQQCTACGADWYSGAQAHRAEGCGGAWAEVIDPLTVDDTLPDLAAWLLRHPSWIRTHAAAEELYDELVGGIRGGWRAVDRPADLKFLGICPAVLVDEDSGDEWVCGGELYARPAAVYVVCPGCQAPYAVDQRRTSLLDDVADQLLSATEMSRALPGLLAQPVTAAQVRGLAHRGRLASHPPHPLDVRAAPRYRVGDVVELLTELAAENAAKASVVKEAV